MPFFHDLVMTYFLGSLSFIRLSMHWGLIPWIIFGTQICVALVFVIWVVARIGLRCYTTTVLQSRLFDSSRTCADGMFLIGSRGHAWRTASSRRSRVWQQAHLLSKRDATTNQTFHFIKDLRTAPGKWHIRKRINAKWDCRCQNAWSYVKSISYQRKFLLIDSAVTFGETNYLNDVVTFIIFQCLSSPAQTKWAYSQLPPLRKCLLFFVYHYLSM